MLHDFFSQERKNILVHQKVDECNIDFNTLCFNLHSVQFHYYRSVFLQKEKINNENKYILPAVWTACLNRKPFGDALIMKIVSTQKENRSITLVANGTHILKLYCTKF